MIFSDPNLGDRVRSASTVALLREPAFLVLDRVSGIDPADQIRATFLAAVAMALGALPELARVYAAVKAGRLFLADYIGDAQRERFAQEDEQRAWINLRRDQTAISDINIFDMRHIGRKLIRGRRWGSE